MKQADRRPVILWAGALICLCLGFWLPQGVAGAYEIGHTSYTFIDAERGNRGVPTEVFYPAVTAGEDVPPAAPPDGGFPVVCFGHGYQIGWDDYTYLREGLAGNGLVVALPRTGSELFPDHLEFGQDLAFASRALRAESLDPSSLFYGALSAAAAIGGHSMGGGASFLGTAGDSTVAALFNLAAAETDPSAIQAAFSITCDALVFSGSLDCVTPPAGHQVPMYESLASECKTYINITGASHCQFAEYNFLCGLGEIGCPSPTITRGQQHAVTMDLLVPWLHAVLYGDSTAWAEFRNLLETLTGITWVQDCGTSGVQGDHYRACDPAGTSIESRISPNPFTQRTEIRFSITDADWAWVEVFSVEGRRVRCLGGGHMEAGIHSLSWDGCDQEGRPMPAGVYFYRVTSGGSTSSGPVLLVR